MPIALKLFIFAANINFFLFYIFTRLAVKSSLGAGNQPCVLLPRRPVRRVAGRLPWRPHSRGFPPAPERGGGHQCGHPHLIHFLQRWERRARRQVKENSLSTFISLFIDQITTVQWRQTLNVVFTGVYRLEIQSVMLVFWPGFVNYCPSTFSPVHLPPPLPCVNK